MIDTSFEIDRAIVITEEDTPSPLHNASLIPIQEAKNQLSLPDELRVHIAHVNDKTLIFDTKLLVYRHVVQGKLDNDPWMVAFCMICNGGTCFSPQIEGEVSEFRHAGYYNGIIFLADKTSDSYWDTLTGKALYGKHAGKKLQQYSQVQETVLKNAMEAHPDAYFVVSDLDGENDETATNWDAYRTDHDAEMFPWAVSTLNKEDDRLPRMEAGLGVYHNKKAKFYPYRKLNALNNAFIDTFGDDKILIMIDPTASVPVAYVTDSSSFEWRGTNLWLKNGDIIKNGVIYDRNSDQKPATYPRQLFQRWFSFVLLYPNIEIFE